MRPFARPIRLVVTDIDGTLVKHDRTLAPSTIEAAGRLRAAGVKLALISSRPAHGLDVLLAPLGIDTPRAGFNGGEILDPEDRVLRERTIPEGACREAVAMLEAAGVDVWVFTGGEWLLKNPQAHYIPREQLSISMGFRVVEDFAPHLAKVHKVMGTSTDFALIGRLEAEVGARVGRAAAVHRSQDYYLDVTHREANKGAAALALAELLGIDPAEMACLGDMPNDLPMFEVSGFAVAMGNAGEAVRARADAVTADNDSDGWALAIDRFVLPRAARPGLTTA
jgi:Cof subfamily protein (haloacid dehalogenase superfamily)